MASSMVCRSFLRFLHQNSLNSTGIQHRLPVRRFHAVGHKPGSFSAYVGGCRGQRGLDHASRRYVVRFKRYSTEAKKPAETETTAEVPLSAKPKEQALEQPNKPTAEPVDSQPSVSPRRSLSQMALAVGKASSSKLYFMTKMPIESAFVNPIRLIKPFLFCSLFSLCSFCGCAMATAEPPPIVDVMPRLRDYIDLDKYFSLDMAAYLEEKSDYFIGLYEIYYNDQSSGRKLALSLASLNLAVLLMWKMRVFDIIMRRYFATNPVSMLKEQKFGPRYWPLLLSTFSHYSIIHFAINMYVLDSFCRALVPDIGTEETLAIYLSAGVFSSWTSYVARVLTTTASYSLGASGAILGLISVYCLKHPEGRLGLVFLPEQFSFKAEHALYGLITVDLACLLLRFKLFDHAAHLGGSLFGIVYERCGLREIVWNETFREVNAATYKILKKVKKSYRKIIDRIKDPFGIGDD